MVVHVEASHDADAQHFLRAVHVTELPELYTGNLSEGLFWVPLSIDQALTRILEYALPRTNELDLLNVVRDIHADMRIPVFGSPPDGFHRLQEFVETSSPPTVGVVYTLMSSDPTPVGLVVATMGTIVLLRVVDPVLDAVGEGISDRVRRWLQTPKRR